MCLGGCLQKATELRPFLIVRRLFLQRTLFIMNIECATQASREVVERVVRPAPAQPDRFIGAM